MKSIFFKGAQRSAGLGLRPIIFIALTMSSLTLSGCAAFNSWLPGSGAIRSEITSADNVLKSDPNAPTLQLVEINELVTRNLQDAVQTDLFSQVFETAPLNLNLVAPGDALEINIWEASPPILFGSSSSASISIVNSTSSKATTLPEQIVNQDGTITIPFAGSIRVVGKTTQAISRDIVDALKGKANYPQVIVRISRNASAIATVVGEVNNSQLVPLTPKQEKLLDAIALSGGVKQPINKMTIQLARNGRVHSMPLESIIKDPKQNIQLTPGDVVTAYFQPFSFTALGATGQNQEITFEATGISLIQALARVGGVQDNRADGRGIFLFRFEDSNKLPPSAQNGIKTADGKVPVIYRLNLTDASAFLTAQNFPVRNKDVLYVANASSVELQKFLNILVSAMYPVVNAGSIGIR